MNKTTIAIVRLLVPRAVRNWTRNPVGTVSYLLNRVSFLVGKRETVSPAEGWKLKCHPAAKQHFEVFSTDPIQASELAGFAAQCCPGMRLLDLGAHYGAMSLAAVHYGGNDVRVLAVEASSSALSILEANLALNNAERMVSAVCCAVGDSDGFLEMLTTGPGDYFVVPTESRNDTTRVPQKTIETILTESSFNPTHIKIDIESFEYEVVLASKDYFAANSPCLFLELHGDLLKTRKRNPEVIIQTLSDCGYNQFNMNNTDVSVAEMKEAGFNCRLVCRKKF